MKTVLSLSRFTLAFSGLVLLPIVLFPQNIGVGVSDPLEKLQVHGAVFSDSVGFRFPDGSLQARAVSSYESQDAGDVRWIIVMDVKNPSVPGSFTFDTLVNKIKVLDYQWGVSITGGGAGAPTITNKKLKIIKNYDCSTNPLLQKALNGNYLADIRLYFFRHLPIDDFQLYYTIMIQGVQITSFDQHAVFIGGDGYAHLDFIEFDFVEAFWFYNDGPCNNQANFNFMTGQ